MGSTRRPSAPTPGQAGTPLRAGTFPRPRGERRRQRPPLLPPHRDSPAGTNRCRPSPLGCGPPGQPRHPGDRRPPPWPQPGSRPRPQPLDGALSARGPAEGRPLPPFSEERRPPIADSVTPLTPPPLRMRGSGARTRAPPPPSPTAAPANPPPPRSAPPSPGDLNMLIERPPEALWRGREAVTWGGDVSFGGGPRPAQAPLKAGGERGSASVRERKCRGGRAAAGPPETSE